VASTATEFVRVNQLLSGLTISVPIMAMNRQVIERIEAEALADTELAALERELNRKFRAVVRPEDHGPMAQVYEAYSEASFYLAMKDKGISLERTAGTGGHQAKRPDFAHQHGKGPVYFECKALEIVNPIARHKEMGEEALEIQVDLETRARAPGVHVGKEQEISGHVLGATARERIDAAISKIANNVKPDQVRYGPTVLVVDLGRLGMPPQDRFGLAPVFLQRRPVQACVSGELWQIGFGRIDEQIFVPPDFEGKTNLGGYQKQVGILLQHPGLMAITFFQPPWGTRGAQLLTLWNIGFNRATLTNPCQLEEHDLAMLFEAYSDGLNDERNEAGWEYSAEGL
jgi:hypothetical protein